MTPTTDKYEVEGIKCCDRYEVNVKLLTEHYQWRLASQKQALEIGHDIIARQAIELEKLRRDLK